MKVIRILVYEGDENFLRLSLEGRSIKGGKRLGEENAISEYFIQSPAPFAQDCPIDFPSQEKKE